MRGKGGVSFITPRSVIHDRLDPFYSTPMLLELEARVQRAATHPLRHFARRISGGATPSKKDAGSHYTLDADGVPFIRVQNLTTTGRLDLEDVKRVRRSTHTGLLARSRLSGGELLVKITGVGRMAVASVVPVGFEGNINQHIVAVQTGNVRTSEVLAAYLNLDIVERLASRRATGGTRPALDYAALLSMPVIYNEPILRMNHAAQERYDSRRSEAEKRLGQIDGLLLAELGINSMPEPGTSARCAFSSPFRNLSCNRFDPYFHRHTFAQLGQILAGRQAVRLGDVVQLSRETWDQKARFTTTFPYFEIGAVDVVLGRVKAATDTPIAEAPSRARMLVRPGDLLVSLTRPTRRAVARVPEDLPLAVASNGFAVVRNIDASRLVPEFLFHVLRSSLCVQQLDQRSSGGNYPAVTEEQLLEILIPLPSVAEQLRIATRLAQLYREAATLLSSAADEFQQAKREIEMRLLRL